MRVVVPVYQAGFRVLDEVAVVRKSLVDRALLEGELHVSYAAREVRVEISRQRRLCDFVLLRRPLLLSIRLVVRIYEKV